MFLKFRHILSIRSKTLHMSRPTKENDIIKRIPFVNTPQNAELVLKESVLRRSAYTHTSIKTGESFFNDSDMTSDYFLIVIYSKQLNIPLLTARYYFESSIISNSIKGDQHENLTYLSNSVSDYKLKEGKIFLADRLSGNTASSLYRKYRNYIFLLFYAEILAHNKGCQYILMARKEKYEKLLMKYIRLGLNVVGITFHKGKEHWILLGDLKKGFSPLNISTLTLTLLTLKTLLLRLKKI